MKKLLSMFLLSLALILGACSSDGGSIEGEKEPKVETETEKLAKAEEKEKDALEKEEQEKVEREEKEKIEQEKAVQEEKKKLEAEQAKIAKEAKEKEKQEEEERKKVEEAAKAKEKEEAERAAAEKLKAEEEAEKQMTVENAKEIIEYGGMGEDDELVSLAVEGDEIKAVIKLAPNTFLSVTDNAEVTYSQASDELLAHDGWEVLTIEYVDIGMISMNRSEKETNEAGDYFPAAKIAERLK